MPRLIDERFLTLHPRTALWWEQREQCLRCAHMRRHPGEKSKTQFTSMQCKKTLRGGYGATSCIDAREEGRPCGPDARLFEPKT